MNDVFIIYFGLQNPIRESPAGASPAVAGKVEGPISTPIKGRKIPYAIASGNKNDTKLNIFHVIWLPKCYPRKPAGSPPEGGRQVWPTNSALLSGRKKPFAIASGNKINAKS